MTSATASDSDTDTSGGTDTTGEPDPSCEGLEVPTLDESACTPQASDYMPRTNMSADDTWAACVSDNGQYNLIADTPSSVARVEAYEMIAALLWADGATPSAEDFTAARDVYVTPEGLESRLVRREDLHYDPVPEEEWDPLVDADKQCSVEVNYMNYPDRCVGPAKMSPLVVDAFAAGQTGEGDPAVHAATIEGTLLWFLYSSVYKEANTCATSKAKDCDSAWAYYTGGYQLDGGIGLAARVNSESPESHARIFDGILAVRCWRDLTNEGDTYPLLEELDASDQQLFQQGWEQLDEALHRGYARVVRARMEAMISHACDGSATAADWAFLQVAGPALDREATVRGAPEASTLSALWKMDAPNAQNLADGITALDAVFPCG
ncbi:MAG: hypothetical protein R3A79_06975 [Nannocystaceae bacterium]